MSSNEMKRVEDEITKMDNELHMHLKELSKLDSENLIVHKISQVKYEFNSKIK